MNFEKRAALLIIVVAAAGLFLRTYDLGWETYSYSEIEIKQAADDYAAGNFVNSYYIFDTPPLPKYLFAAAVIINDTEACLRLVSALFGVLTIIALYFFVKKLYNEKTALLASAITAFSIVHVQFSRYVQQETMLSFFFVCSAYFLWEAVNEKKKHTYVFLGSFIGLAMATKFISVVIVVFILIYTIYTRQIKISLRPNFSLTAATWILKSFAVALAVFCILWPFGFARLPTEATIAVDYGGEVRSQTVSTDLPIILLSFGRRLFTSFTAYITYPPIMNIPVLKYFLFYLAKEAVLILPLLIFGAYCIAKRPTRQDKFIVILIVTFLVLISFHGTNITYRHVVAIIPFMAVVASRWLDKVKWQDIAIAGVAVTMFLYAVLTGPSYALYYNPLKDALGFVDTESKMSEGMRETIDYLKANCSSAYAGPAYTFMAYSYYPDFVGFNQSAQCVVRGDIPENIEAGNVTEYLGKSNCSVSRTVYKNSVKILDIYRC